MRYFAFLFVLVSMSANSAEPALDVSYGKWVRINPADVLKPLPDYVPPRSAAGSVTNEYKRKPDGQVLVHSFQNPVPAPFIKPGSK